MDYLQKENSNIFYINFFFFFVQVIAEPLAADPTSLQDQLHRTKAVNNEFLVNGHLIDNAKAAVDALLRSLQGTCSFDTTF